MRKQVPPCPPLLRAPGLWDTVAGLLPGGQQEPANETPALGSDYERMKSPLIFLGIYFVYRILTNICAPEAWKQGFLPIGKDLLVGRCPAFTRGPLVSLGQGQHMQSLG